MNSYELIYDYRDNKHYSSELNNILKKKCKATIEEWMLKNEWDENYVPVSLVNEKNEIVATIHIMKIKLTISTNKANAIQLGKMYIKDGYETKGVDQILLDMVVEKFSHIVDLIYSFSDTKDDTLLLNSKFKRIHEYVYFIPWDSNITSRRIAIKKLDTDNIKDVEFIQNHIRHAARTSSAIATNGDSYIKLYNILKFYRRNVYYVSEIDAVVVFTINQESKKFTLVGLYTKNKIDLSSVLELLIPEEIEVVEFMFVPTLNAGLNIKRLITFDTPEGHIASHLYLHEITTGLEGKKVLFPVLGRGK